MIIFLQSIMIFSSSLLRLLTEGNEFGNLPVEILLLIRDIVNKDIFNEAFTVSLLHNAAQKGYYDCLRLLKEAGYGIGYADIYGQTPAHIAAKYGHVNCLRVLKEAGCDLKAKQIKLD